MKIYNNYLKKIALTIVVGLSLSSCDTEEFLDGVPKDQISIDAFYNTDGQVEQSILPLYGNSWGQFVNTGAFYGFGDIMSGNSISFSNPGVWDLNVSSTNGLVKSTWETLFGIVAQANNIINNVPAAVGEEVSQETLDEVVAEAHFFRGIAYFYLGQLWGNVPIITVNEDLIDNPQVPTNPQDDVYGFVIKDLEAAVAGLPDKIRDSDYTLNERLSKGSAKALMAKVYVTMKDFTNARTMAEDVVGSGEFQLMPNYDDLFFTANNNNEESIFSLQWKANNEYFDGNLSNVFYGTPDISEIGYAGIMGPSPDILNNGFAVEDNTRNKASILRAGNEYSNIVTKDGGSYVVPSTINIQASGSGVKKYAVGIETPSGAGGSRENCTYIMRYADLLLIHAESILGNAASTTDVTALASFNAVRNRAMPDEADVTEITRESLLAERRSEMAFEGQYWYDLIRILDDPDVLSLVSGRDRGWNSSPKFETMTSDDLLLPYPAEDLAKNPMLNEAPVSYNFN